MKLFGIKEIDKFNKTICYEKNHKITASRIG
jgi:hypothetical protein